MLLYRPVSLQELALIYDSGMNAFPAGLPQQPIFYPVLDLEYARQTASDWNAKNGQLAGYVTQFKVEDDYISQFEQRTVGGSQFEEFWIPADQLEEFNKHLVGRIKVVEAYFGKAFQGFIPEQFSLQGKKAVEQFTLLSNSYIYKRMDFYLEIKRNHKAVFLNYPFWQKYNFKNPSLKEKILQAIREAWFTSFPQIPLVPPVQEETKLHKRTDSYRLVDADDEEIAPQEPADSADEDITPSRQSDSRPSVKPVRRDITPVKRTDPTPLADSVEKDVAPVKQRVSHSLAKPVQKDVTPPKQTVSSSMVEPGHDDTPPMEQGDAHVPVKPVREDSELTRQTDSHFMQGIKLGLAEDYHEAIEELSTVVEEDPNHVIAYTSLGVVCHRLGEDERALDCYESALKINPKYAEAHYFQANILYERGDVREAMQGYTIAIGLHPELIGAHQNPIPQDRLTDYAHLPAELYRIAKPALRILEINNSLKTNPRQANLLNQRAAEYSRLWNYEQAIADYSASLRLKPDDANVLHFRGLAYEQIGQHDRALEDYQQATAINPQLSDMYINRGVTFGRMGNFRQSVANLGDAIRLTPQNPNAYFNRGMTYFQQGDLESAINDFSIVIRLSPEDDAAYYWRGISHEEAGHLREAIADYRQFLTLAQDPRAREEIQQRMSQWNEGKWNEEGSLTGDRQRTDPVESEKPVPAVDLYDLIVALGDRALNATWFGSGISCHGENAEKLYASTDNNRPIAGHDLLQLTSGIRQTIKGDFTAFDPDADSHWLFLRAWEGRGFYVEINDPKIAQRLKAHFQPVEEVEGVNAPYEGLFIHI